jgi:hypothetical protein
MRQFDSWARLARYCHTSIRLYRDSGGFSARQMAAFGLGAGVHLLKMTAEVKREYECGPLQPYRIKMLRMFAKNFPDAQNLLQKCLQDQRPRAKKRL